MLKGVWEPMVYTAWDAMLLSFKLFCSYCLDAEGSLGGNGTNSLGRYVGTFMEDKVVLLFIIKAQQKYIAKLNYYRCFAGNSF